MTNDCLESSLSQQFVSLTHLFLPQSFSMLSLTQELFLFLLDNSLHHYVNDLVLCFQRVMMLLEMVVFIPIAIIPIKSQCSSQRSKLMLSL